MLGVGAVDRLLPSWRKPSRSWSWENKSASASLTSSPSIVCWYSPHQMAVDGVADLVGEDVGATAHLAIGIARRGPSRRLQVTRLDLTGTLVALIERTQPSGTATWGSVWALWRPYW